MSERTDLDRIRELMDKNTELRAENERLREALRRIAGYEVADQDGYLDAFAMQDIANDTGLWADSREGDDE